MDAEKGKTVKYLKEKRPVPKEVKEQLKSFTRTKKLILNSLMESDKTIPELAEKLKIPAHEITYQLMSLLKYGMVETGEIDDMDEYFQYKIKENGKD
jgi:predicted ArsR family transcriptional regulator